MITLYWSNLLWVQPWVPLLETRLCCKRSSRGARGKYYTTEQKLYWVENGIGVTYGGFLQKVEESLSEFQMEYRIEERIPPLPPPEIPGELSLRPGQPEMFASIMSARRGGILEYPPACGKTFLLEYMPKMYPSCRILISTARGPVLGSIHQRIQATNPDIRVGLVKAGRKFNPDDSVVVCSLRSLQHIPEAWPQMVFVDECHAAAAGQASKEILKFAGAHFYGLSATPFGRGDKADILTEGIFGPVLHSIPYEEAVDLGSVVPIRVILVRVYDNPIFQKSIVSRERHGLWRNGIRNRLIAQISRQYDLTGKVLILVKTAEHGFFLRNMLPDYELVYSSLDASRMDGMRKLGLTRGTDVLSQKVQEKLQRFRNGDLQKVIATLSWQEGLDIPDLRVLIRADGQGGRIPAVQIGGRLSRIHEESGKEDAVLVDFDDSVNFAERTRDRVAYYREQKWNITRIDPEDIESVCNPRQMGDKP